jgi:hypothetical protein
MRGRRPTALPLPRLPKATASPIFEVGTHAGQGHHFPANVGKSPHRCSGRVSERVRPDLEAAPAPVGPPLRNGDLPLCPRPLQRHRWRHFSGRVLMEYGPLRLPLCRQRDRAISAPNPPILFDCWDRGRDLLDRHSWLQRLDISRDRTTLASTQPGDTTSAKFSGMRLPVNFLHWAAFGTNRAICGLAAAWNCMPVSCR